MHYDHVNTTFDFLGNSLLEKGKYLVIESSCFCVEKLTMKFYRFIVAFLFLKIRN